MSTSKIEISKEQSKANPSPDVSKDDLIVELQERVIDNPAKGNCGYYAFAIGLINIIQQDGARTTFDKWVSLDPSISSYYNAICKFDFDKPDNDLLEALQRILRLITYNFQIDELRWACTSAQRNDEYRALVATSTYGKFSEMYNGTNVDPRFNQFVSSSAIKKALAKIDPSTVTPKHEALVLAPLFMSLLYGEDVAPETITVRTDPKFDSPVIQALQNVTRDSVWATHLELDYLANAFEVNLHTLENGVQRYEFHDLPSRHTITLNNQANIHWTTRVTMIKKASKTPDQSNEPLGVTSLLGLSSKITELETEIPAKKQFEKEKDTATKKLPAQYDDPKRKKGVIQREVRPVPTAPEKEHHKTQIKPSPVHDKPALLRKSNEIPLEVLDLKENQKELNRLIRVVNRAVIEYSTYSDGIIFSFFHRHGESGRVRARAFNGAFSSAKDLDQAKEMLIEFLNDPKNGNTHPHSFRTMLLQGALRHETYKKKDLKYISKNYSELLAEYEALLTPDEDYQFY